MKKPPPESPPKPNPETINDLIELAALIQRVSALVCRILLRQYGNVGQSKRLKGRQTDFSSDDPRYKPANKESSASPNQRVNQGIVPGVETD